MTVDLWYTLVYQRPEERRRYERGRRAAWDAALRRAGVGPREAARWARAVDRRGSLGGLATIEDRIRWLERQVGCRVDGDVLRRSLDRVAETARIQVVPGAKRFLHGAASRGIPVGLLSNITHESPAAIRRLLDRTDLARFLSVVALSNETRLAKPDPAAFRALWRRLGVRRASTIHIGDTAADVDGARRSNAPVWLFVGASRWAPRRDRLLRSDHPPEVPRFSSWEQVSDRLFGAPRRERPEARPVRR